MERTIVIYKSKNGSTEKYAKWIAETLDCKEIKTEDFSKKDFKNYEKIISGGCILYQSDEADK